MSDTLTNSGPLETGEIPTEDSQIAGKNIPVIAPSTVSAPVEEGSKGDNSSHDGLTGASDSSCRAGESRWGSAGYAGRASHKDN